MSALSNYLEENLLNAIYNKVGFTSPIGTYVALYTTDPTDAGNGTEVSGGDYARVLVHENGGASPAWAAAAADAPGYKVSNAHDIVFPTATAAWGTVTHMAVWSAAVGGNLLHHGQLTAQKVVGIGDTFKFLAGQLNLRLE